MAERHRPSRWLGELSRDGWLIFITGAFRSFAYGFLSVMLALYLEALGLDSSAIGLIFAAALAGGALMTILITGIADRVGRRRMLVISALLMAGAGAVFGLATDPAILMIAAVVGTVSPSGREVGPFLSLEQAILPDTTSPDRRTSVFAGYNLVNSLTRALGALAAGLPELLSIEELTGFRLLIWCYVATALLLVALFQRLSPAIEVLPNRQSRPTFGLGLHRSRGIVLKLGALFALDAFAGGFVIQGLMSYWLYLRFGADTASLAVIFFAMNLAAALTFPAAVPIARRFGLLNTMVFTQVPANLMFFIVPLMPNLWSAVAVLVVRSLIAQLDIPTRQSYTIAVVAPDERSAAAGITSVARNVGSALSPTLAGVMLAAPALGLPFLVAGTLKLLYDAIILTVFRNIRPPDELAKATTITAQPVGSTRSDGSD